jgi:hypothetical protein
MLQFMHLWKCEYREVCLLDEIITVDELRAIILNEELMKQLPLSKEIIEYIVELVRIETTTR